MEAFSVHVNNREMPRLFIMMENHSEFEVQVVTDMLEYERYKAAGPVT